VCVYVCVCVCVWLLPCLAERMPWLRRAIELTFLNGEWSRGADARTCVCVCDTPAADITLKPWLHLLLHAVAFDTAHRASIWSPRRARDMCAHVNTQTHTHARANTQLDCQTDTTSSFYCGQITLWSKVKDLFAFHDKSDLIMLVSRSNTWPPICILWA